jgi:hypothetical protein
MKPPKGPSLLERLIIAIEEIAASMKAKKKEPSFSFNVAAPISKEMNMLDLNCTTEEKILVTCTPVTSTGKVASLDGPLVVSVINGNGSVEMVGDLSFFLVSGDDPGDTSFLVDGDADLGSGVVDVQDTIVLHVAGALAANLGLSAGTPIPK